MSSTDDAAVEALRAQVNTLRALAPFQGALRMAANEMPPLTESERAVAEHYGVAAPRAVDEVAYLRGRERHWYDAAERAENRYQNLLAEAEALRAGRLEAIDTITALRSEVAALRARLPADPPSRRAAADAAVGRISSRIGAA